MLDVVLHNTKGLVTVMWLEQTFQKRGYQGESKSIEH